MSGFILKVLAGPHAGAEIQIDEGNFLIGTHEDNDLVFSDPSLAKRQLRLVLSHSGLAIQPLELPVYLKGKPLGSGGGVFNAFDVITIGDTSLAVAEASAQWPAIELPKIRKKAGGTDQPDNAGAQKSRGPARLLSPRIAFPAMLAIAGVYFANTQFGSETTELPGTSKLANILEDLNATDLESLKQPDGSIRLSGYVDDSATLVSLNERLDESGLNVINRVHAVNELEVTTKRVLMALGYDRISVSAVEDKPGEVLVQGFVDNDSARKRIVDTLRYDIPGIRNIDYSQVETLDQRLEYLTQEIRKAGLDQSINTTASGGVLQLTGSVNNLQEPKLADIENAFIKQYGDEPALENRVKVKTNSFSLALQSVSIGKTAFITTKNGRKYIEGAYVEDGYMIKSIEPGKIVLSRNGSELDYFYGRKQ